MKEPLRAGARCCCALIVVTALALDVVASASAHAEISPDVVKAKALQLFSLAVPTEKSNAKTTEVEMTPPSGFSIDSFAPSPPGWKRSVQSSGSGDQAVVQKVTWTGGDVPTGEDAFFQFLASTAKAKSYTFKVRQTYSDGSIVDWSGPESSDSPAPVIEASSSLGGGGSSSTLAIVALAVAVLAAVLAGASLLSRSARGGRSLT
jgi:uncharacterized protein YcnI